MDFKRKIALLILAGLLMSLFGSYMLAMEPTVIKDVNGQIVQLTAEQKNAPKNKKVGIINYVKNKTAYAFNSIVDTVKSDLGLSDKKEQESLGIKDLVAGCRLYCYTYATRAILMYLLKNTNFLTNMNFFDNMPTQFEKRPSILSTIGIAPILEESVLTHGLANVVLANSFLQLPVVAQTLVPLLFGALHYHDNPKRYVWNIMCLSPLSFYNIRYVLTREKITRSPALSLAPMISHMLNNIIACYYCYYYVKYK